MSTGWRHGLVLVVAILSAPGTLRTQISPGRLAQPHASLEGTLRCTKCHAGGSRDAMTAQCVSCHRDIGWLVERRRGLHGTQEARACASCHPDHAGAEFQLIRWPDGSPEQFDHKRAGWVLEKSHARLRCADCHSRKYRVSPAAALAAARTTDAPGAWWTGLERTCTACHTEPHDGAFRRGCTACHDAGRWIVTPGFDHAETRYPLTGKHREVGCDDCHRPSTGGKPVYRPIAFAQCSSCHTDPHRGRLSERCDQCHATTSFRVLNASFDHSRTRYPLRGRHAAVRCEACHDFSARQEAGRSPAFATCTACHEDVHGGTATLAGQRLDCDGCHTERGFTPSTMAVASHDQTRYPLEGRHRQAGCGSCHTRTASEPRRWGSVRVVMRPTFAACASCHVDPHRWPVARPCEDCHATAGFRPSTMELAAHAQTRFVLEGAHRAVPCAACHQELQTARRPRSTLAASAREWPALALAAPLECARCHETPHGGQFATRPDRGRCDACHDASAWSPAARFDHDRDATFALERSHARVPCDRCHRPLRGAREGTVVYRPLSGACEACHVIKAGRNR